MINSHGRIYSLRNYEEAVGDLTDINIQDGLLLVQIGKVKLSLPAYMVDSLKPLLGQRIAILRTDIPNKSYLIRIISAFYQLLRKIRGLRSLLNSKTLE